jgi:hypothetical protein
MRPPLLNGSHHTGLSPVRVRRVSSPWAATPQRVPRSTRGHCVLPALLLSPTGTSWARARATPYLWAGSAEAMRGRRHREKWPAATTDGRHTQRPTYQVAQAGISRHPSYSQPAQRATLADKRPPNRSWCFAHFAPPRLMSTRRVMRYTAGYCAHASNRAEAAARVRCDAGQAMMTLPLERAVARPMLIGRAPYPGALKHTVEQA